MKNNSTGVARVIAAFGFSVKGLKTAYRNEAAFRQEVYLALIMVPAAFFVGNTALEKALLIASIMLVLIVELLNTAVENVVDRFGAEYHELSGAAKDTGSAAVLVALLLVVVVWTGVILT